VSGVQQPIDVHIHQTGNGVWLPIAGVVVGAFLAGGIRLVLDYLAEKQRLRAAIWMLRDDLDRMNSVLDPERGQVGFLGVRQSAIGADERFIGWLRSDAWQSERARLARGFRRDRDLWNQTRWTMLQVEVLIGLAADHGERGRPETVIRWAATRDDLAHRIAGLSTALAQDRPFRPWLRNRVGSHGSD
jgi:hypothetical protein